MATITTTVKVWINEETIDVLTEKEINEIKAKMIADWLSDCGEKFDRFEFFCDIKEIYCADIMFVSEERRAEILAEFDEHLKDCADEEINARYTEREIEVELEVNA